VKPYTDPAGGSAHAATYLAETARAQLGNTASKMKKTVQNSTSEAGDRWGKKFVGARRELHGPAQPR